MFRHHEHGALQYRILGRTGIRVSVVAFGAGPISTLMVGDDAERQLAVIDHAIRRGVNWFDTAATYGNGQSEHSLGRALEQLGVSSQVHVATKVRLIGDDLNDIPGAVRRSFEQSLTRLRLSCVTLLQLHNSLTLHRNDEPTSLTPADVLTSGGVLDAFEQLRADGMVKHLGLTGIGHPASLAEIVRSGRVDTMQVPYHMLNPSAGRVMPPDFTETDYGNIIAECAAANMGVFAIRVLAGGALAQNPPSPHTFKTPFFPLALYERDLRRAAQLQSGLIPGCSLPQTAIAFAASHPQVHSLLIGFAEPAQIDEAVTAADSIAASLDVGLD